MNKTLALVQSHTLTMVDCPPIYDCSSVFWPRVLLDLPRPRPLDNLLADELERINKAKTFQCHAALSQPGFSPSRSR